MRKLSLSIVLSMLACVSAFPQATIQTFATLSAQNIFTGPMNTFRGLTATSITDTSLTPGLCVQVGTNGLLTTAANPCGSGGGGGGVSAFSASNLSPIFTTTVTNPNTTPALLFILTNAGANTVLGNPAGSSAGPVYTANPSVTSIITSSGSASAPPHTFTGHTTSGLYYNSSTGPVLSTSGFDILGINPSAGSPGPVGVPFGGGLSWYPTSGNVFTGGTQDVGISRLSTGLLSIDTSTKGNSAGSLNLSGMVAANISVANLTITTGCTGCPGGTLSTLTAATGNNTILNGAFSQEWRWSLGAATNVQAMTFSGSDTGGGSGNYTVSIQEAAGSSTSPLRIFVGSNGITVDSSAHMSVTGSATIAATTSVTSTNLAGGAADSVPYQTGVGATAFIPIGSNGQCYQVITGVPGWGSCAGGGAITGSSLSANQIAYATSSSNITSTANFTFDGTHTMQLPAGGVIGTPDTGTPKFTFAANLITSNVNMNGVIFNASTGFRIGGAAASGNFLRGDGTNFVSNTIQAGDIPSLSGTYCAITGCTLTGGLLFSTDNTLDIGNLSTFRPRDGNFGRHLVSADYTSSGTATPDIYTEQAAPGSSPSAGFLNTWADSTDHRFHDKNSSGVTATSVVSGSCPTSNWLTGISTAGIQGCLQPVVADVTGAAPIDSPVFTTSVIGPNYGFNTRGTVSVTTSAGKGAAYFTLDQNYGLATALATNIAWPVSQAVITTGGGGTVVFTLSTPTNAISWFPTDCFQLTGLPATDGLSSLNGVDLALSAKSPGTPTSTVTVTIAGTANSCQTGTVGTSLTSATVSGLTATANHYDQYLNGNTTVFNRLSSSSANCPNYGSLRLCSGGTTSSDQITAYDPTTTDMFTLLRRNPVSGTGSNWAQIGDSTHAAYAPGGLNTPAISISGGSPPTACTPATGCIAQSEASTAGTPTTAQDYCRADSTTHGYKCSLNNSAEFPSAMNSQQGMLASGSGSLSVASTSEIVVCTSTCTVTVLVPAPFTQVCVMNGDNVSTVITLAAIGSSARYENTARTAYGTAGTGTFVSAGAVGDSVCIVGLDSTHYITPTFKGTWTAS